eukprot:TRINITY_DN70642_c0_g1_i1.p2 TRINITY_DN70642_c0_g1~~TRINITY_DN70642_c0_g1_i1.p2  ORF type:complete len:255 (+),score=123.74 TRINITY_DN70642_c0_g1_i1:86-766(+)
MTGGSAVAPLSQAVADWKDARVVLNQDEFDQAVRKLFSAISARERGGSGEDEAPKEALAALSNLAGWAEADRMLLMEQRCHERVEALRERTIAAQERQLAAVAELGQLAGEAEACEAEWVEVKELPALLKQLEGKMGVQEWAKKMEKSREQRDEAKAAAAAAARHADEVREGITAVLHRCALTASLADRAHSLSMAPQQLQRGDRRRAASPAPAPGTPAAKMSRCI